MSESSLEALERRRAQLEEEVRRLEEEARKVRELYDKAKKLEDEAYEALRGARDQSELSRLELRYLKVSDKRKAIEAKLNEFESRLRGAAQELEEVKRKIELRRPRPARWVEEKPG